MVKNPPTDAGDTGSIPGLARAPGVGSGNHSNTGKSENPIFLAWKIPWTEQPGGLQFIGSQRGGHD